MSVSKAKGLNHADGMLKVGLQTSNLQHPQWSKISYHSVAFSHLGINGTLKGPDQVNRQCVSVPHNADQPTFSV